MEQNMQRQRVYGYVRVSTREQNTDRQVNAILEYGVPAARIYQDKVSGKDFNRPAYQQMLKRIRAGDTVVIKSIDRLGRNYQEILDQWRMISKEKGANIVVLDMPLLTTGQGKDLTGTLISDIVLQLLSYVAETERIFIRQRQAEGIRIAREKGVVFGRKPKEKPEIYPMIYKQWKNGSLSARGAAARLGIHHKTFLRWTRENRQ